MSLSFIVAILVGAPPEAAPDFNRDVKPILASRCFACHGLDEKHRQAGLRLDDRAVAIKKLESENTAIVPGRSQESELLKRVRADNDERMPPKGSGERLAAKEIAILEKWIEAGAEYSPHWSFVPPKKVKPPVSHSGWAKNAIDEFIEARLASHGLQPSPQAERGILLRRVSFDLTGLPPTQEQLEAFLKDDSEGAFERAVDRLLADPGFGERWARVWLDLARYADSAGYGSDPLRTIWRYRDWVIDAHNRNLPFDEFTRVQLAGDLLPKPSPDDLVATAFHRNTMTNTEGGTDDEEFRIAAVKDRTDVTMQVWMGLTVGCAKCHSHKYDPISHKEYYQLTAFFNQTADTDQPTETPTLLAPTADQRRENARIDAEITKLGEQLKRQSPGLVAKQKDWERELSPNKDKPWKPIAAKASLDGDTIRIVGPLVAESTALRLSSSSAQLDLTVSDVRLEVGADQSAGKPVVGRIVRIDLPGKGKMIHLAEVEVFSAGTNVAKKGKAKQSSDYISAFAQRAVDGNRDGRFESGSVAHTNPQKDPWWEVDLGADVAIDRVSVWNRTDALEDRLKGWSISILDKDRKVVWRRTPKDVPKPSEEFAVDGWKSVALANPPASFTWKSGSPLTLTPASPLARDAASVRLSVKATSKPSAKSLDGITLTASADPIMTRRAALPPAVATALESPLEKRSADQNRIVADFFREQIAGKPLTEAIARLEKARPKPATVPVMQELSADKKRPTRILEKGNFLQPGETVTAAAPKAFHAWPTSAPKDRLGLSQWLMKQDNPLAARVAVNRLWARLFGRGLVETEEDFGIQGEHPSHPELLDWLANEYVRSGWDTKAMLRLMVASATYRQSTKSTPLNLEKDPDVRWLSRFPRLRLEAEMVRDQALAASGTLVRKIGGPSVFPRQPDGLWQAAFNGERTWSTSVGADSYRRGLYTFWRRTIPYPSMAAFDAPSRETCTLRRKNTNTPLQAFVTLNDPVYVDLSRALAKRIVSQGGSTMEERARFGLRVILCREPSPEQTAAVVKLVESTKTTFDADAAKKWGGDPPAGMDAREFAAWTLAANALMNLDGFLTKG